MMMSGALIGVFAPYVIKGFDVISILPNLASKTLHQLLQDLHELLFNLMIGAVMLHAIFHLWRHTALRDNALRIMVPSRFHMYL